MLELRNISKSYQIRQGRIQHVLNNLNLTLPSSGFISILGSSGNGKTTLVNIIAGLAQYDSGKIYYNQKEIADYEAFRRQKVGVVFQDFNLIRHLNAVDNVIVSMSDQQQNKKEIATKILKRLGLADCLDKLPGQLSGGQRQRVAIARRIAKDVDIIICDEPTGSLDEVTEIKIADIIKELAQQKLVLFVTHNRALAEKYSDRILKISNGRVAADTSNEQIIDFKAVYSSKTYSRSSGWLAIKNLLGRYRSSLKYILLATFIMLVATMAIILQGDFFKRYLHENWVAKGLKNAVLDINRDGDYDGLAADLTLIDNVDYATYIYGKKIEIAATGGSKVVRETAFENIAGNDYFKDIITDGRFPEKSDEVLMSAWGAISLLRDLDIGGDRLYDQYMTGGMSSAYVYSLVDDKKFIISEPGNPRIKIVGLVDDRKVHESEHILYHIAGFTDLFEWPFSYWHSAIKLYKDGLYRPTHQQVVSMAEKNDSLVVNQKYQTKIEGVYKKIDSVIALSKMALYVVLALASISFVSLLLTALFERKYEIGLYRAIGYSKKNIRKILGLEMLIIGAIATLLVLILLVIFAFVMYFKLDYMVSLIDVFSNFKLLNIAVILIAIVVGLVLIVTYGGSKIVLNQSILSNINDL